ncbi:MAG: hypothetical protein NWF08_00260 [Candidatus Bathyarchaeota archaeon]|nr:hypothetical protein [Candidatus Bathyarchaeota archaeon]
MKLFGLPSLGLIMAFIPPAKIGVECKIPINVEPRYPGMVNTVDEEYMSYRFPDK